MADEPTEFVAEKTDNAGGIYESPPMPELETALEALHFFGKVVAVVRMPVTVNQYRRIGHAVEDMAKVRGMEAGMRPVGQWMVFELNEPARPERDDDLSW